MSSISQRFAKVCGGFWVLAAASLAGCTATTGGAAFQPSAAPAAGYVVCSGGRASRFPEQEEIGRICRPSTSLQAIY